MGSYEGTISEDGAEVVGAWTQSGQSLPSDYTVVKLSNLNHLFQTSATGSPSEYAQIEETFSPRALGVISDWILRHVR